MSASVRTAVRSRPMVAAALDAVAGDVADHQPDPAAGQGDHVEPVAADRYPALAGQVAGGDLDGGLRGLAPLQQAVLQGQRGGVLAGVAAGVVDADRGAGDDFLGEGQVVGVEGLRPLMPDEGGHAERGPAGAHGTDMTE